MSKPYDPALVEASRERARRGEPILKRLDIYARIEYECMRCGARYMGDEEHRCDATHPRRHP